MVRQKLREWVVAATGLPSASVLWADTGAAAPTTFPWISLSLVSQQQSGVPDSVIVDSDTGETTITCTIELTVWARCYGSDPGMAAGVARSVSQQGNRDLLQQGAGNLTIQSVKGPRQMPQLRGTVQQHMALMELCVWYGEQAVDEDAGWFQYATGDTTLQESGGEDIVVEIEAGTPPTP